MNFNKVIVGGNMTRDPELRYLPNGTPVAQFGVAVNRKWKSESGEEREEVTFVDVTAWARMAEVVAQYFKKGKPILVEGRLTLDQWEDKNTHEKRSKLKVTMEGFSFAGGDRDREDAGADTDERRQASGNRRPPQRTGEAPQRDSQDTGYQQQAVEEDDVPF